MLGEHYLHYLKGKRDDSQDFLEQAFNSRFLLQLIEHNPETVLAWVQLARDLGGERFIKYFTKKSPVGEEFFERALDPCFLLQLSERNPEAALAWLQMARDLGGERLNYFDGEGLDSVVVFTSVFNSRFLLQLIERNPEAALAWLQMARDFFGERFFKYFDEVLYEQHFNSSKLNRLLIRNPAAFVVPLSLARTIESRQAIAVAEYCSLSFLQQAEGNKNLLRSLPLASHTDLQWLARKTGGPRLSLLLDTLLNDIKLF